uniref:Uncharacterized protein n=1 Tax=Aegilops tauschii subsp. strangulata TaxID=200361 RepID=A0A453N6L7_AEGTS
MARGYSLVMVDIMYTYGILIDSSCCSHRPNLGSACSGCLLMTYITLSIIAFGNLIKCLCDMKRTNEALDVLLHMMLELPDYMSGVHTNFYFSIFSKEIYNFFITHKYFLKDINIFSKRR